MSQLRELRAALLSGDGVASSTAAAGTDTPSGK